MATLGYFAYASVVNMKVAGTWGNQQSIVVQPFPAVKKKNAVAGRHRVTAGLLSLDRFAHLIVLKFMEPSLEVKEGGVPVCRFRHFA
jgi:hypothetical protein